jgi:hypothetical protein
MLAAWCWPAERSREEWQAAYRDDATGEAGWLIPVRVRECSPRGILAGRTWIDLVGLDEDRARGALLAGVEQRRAKPSRAPSFPVAVRPATFPPS